ncbi:trypsin-like serine peptidase [Agreia pratensis]|uniref:V8-like Glu-specific endopeptidase n=1 Tax=Agreia pratensis TaxID=150121 RepID=A0A1X7KTF6_9MICO|nr:hypothetical protein [Agreia pratensis]SMG44144.1 hypothetical protein SAMN06296010_2844 [Agreia pratensis]
MLRFPHRAAMLRAGVVVAATLAASVVAVAPSAWASDSGNADTVSLQLPHVLPLQVTPEDAERAVEYWTPERMVAAERATDSGEPTSAPDSSHHTALPSAAGDEIAESAEGATATATPVSVAQQVAPVSHIGRVFYTLNGADHACSANVVQSANRSTVATAAHCMTGDGGFSVNSVFVPGYENGEAPYGSWPVVAGEIAGGFTENNADQADDTGFLVVAHNDDDADIVSVVGGSPVLFNQSPTQEGSVFGYPAAGRFNGETLQTCSGQFEAFANLQQIDLPCDMNEGVSGGPMFEGDSPEGAQFANEDARYEDYSHIIGPIWQDNEESAYNLAAAVAVSAQ